MTQNKLKIAITGGIGSGKSTVANIIAELGYPVISCDKVYSELLRDQTFVKKIADEFVDCVTCEGELDRKKLSAIVFSDKEKLERLNTLTHPEIMKRVLTEMEVAPISFCEVPLLFEGGYERLFDKIIVVMRENSGRLEAIIKRDKITEAEALKRLNNQFNYENLQFEKYYVIHNNHDMVFLRNKVCAITEDIINQK